MIMNTNSQEIKTSLLGNTRFAVDKHKAQEFSTGCIKALEFGGVSNV